MREAIAVIHLAVWVALAGFTIGYGFASDRIMREAFERGHAVQCLGRIGYHWECGE